MCVLYFCPDLERRLQEPERHKTIILLIRPSRERDILDSWRHRCRLLFTRSPTQQNDRGFVALRRGIRAAGPGLAAEMFGTKPGRWARLFAVYQVNIGRDNFSRKTS